MGSSRRTPGGDLVRDAPPCSAQLETCSPSATSPKPGQAIIKRAEINTNNKVTPGKFQSHNHGGAA